jgi:HEAT repeat protein
MKLKISISLLSIVVVFVFISGCASENSEPAGSGKTLNLVQDTDQPPSENEEPNAEVSAFRKYLPETIAYVEKEWEQGTFYSDPIEDAVRTMVRAQDASVIPIYKRILAECPVAEARKDVVDVIGLIKDPAVIPILKKALEDKDYQVKTHAAVTLAELGEYAAAFPILKKVALSEDAEEWELDVDFILNVGQDIKKTKDEESKYKKELIHGSLPHKAMSALGIIGDDRSVEIIKTMYDRSDIFMKITAAYYLIGTKYDNQIIPEMIGIVRDDDVEDLDRIRALAGMIDRSNRDFRELLEELKNGPNEYLSRQVEMLLRNQDKSQ